MLGGSSSGAQPSASFVSTIETLSMVETAPGRGHRLELAPHGRCPSGRAARPPAISAASSGLRLCPAASSRSLGRGAAERAVGAAGVRRGLPRRQMSRRSSRRSAPSSCCASPRSTERRTGGSSSRRSPLRARGHRRRGRRWSGSDEWETAPAFTDRERAAILWADRVARRLARRDAPAYRDRPRAPHRRTSSSSSRWSRRSRRWPTASRTRCGSRRSRRRGCAAPAVRRRRGSSRDGAATMFERLRPSGRGTGATDG